MYAYIIVYVSLLQKMADQDAVTFPDETETAKSDNTTKTEGTEEKPDQPKEQVELAMRNFIQAPPNKPNEPMEIWK